MKLYILRHGDAEASRGQDENRKLTEHGRRQIQSVAMNLESVNLTVVSSFLRAQETADLVLDCVKSDHRIASESLTPDCNVSEVMSWLEDVDAERTLLVSHNPLVTLLTQWLTGDSNMRYGTGTLVCLEGEVIGPQCMTVKWVK